MIQGLIGKKVLAFVLKQVMKAISKKWDLDKMRSYVEDDNELDIQIRQQQKTISKQGQYIEELEKDVAMLKKDSHPPVKNVDKRLRWLEKKAR